MENLNCGKLASSRLMAKNSLHMLYELMQHVACVGESMSKKNGTLKKNICVILICFSYTFSKSCVRAKKGRKIHHFYSNNMRSESEIIQLKLYICYLFQIYLYIRSYIWFFPHGSFYVREKVTIDAYLWKNVEERYFNFNFAIYINK